MVELYRGPLLEGCMEEWLLPERASREHEFLQAVEALAAVSNVQSDLKNNADQLNQQSSQNQTALQQAANAQHRVGAVFGSHEVRMISGNLRVLLGRHQPLGA